MSYKENIIEYTSSLVEEISGGHIVLGPKVATIRSIKRVDFGDGIDITVKEYQLPTRIDFKSSNPPNVISVKPGAISSAELHVPSGALNSYLNHPQWGKAAYFVDADGNIVDKFADKHKARLKKLKKKQEKANLALAEKGKQEKLQAIGEMIHPILAKERLSKWEYICIKDMELMAEGKLLFQVKISPLFVNVTFPKSASPNIWDSIVAHLQEVEDKLK